MQEVHPPCLLPACPLTASCCRLLLRPCDLPVAAVAFLIVHWARHDMKKMEEKLGREVSA